MRERIQARLGPLAPVDGGRLDGEARLYRLADGLGDVGFISSVTEPFCASCTRARLTADGKLRMCLLREYEVDLLTPLRAGASNDDLKALILKGVHHKPWGHGLAHNVVPMNRVMSEIGG
jgi:cyclic pyranopterin phosphate synthase